MWETDESGNGDGNAAAQSPAAVAEAAVEQKAAEATAAEQIKAAEKDGEKDDDDDEAKSGMDEPVAHEVVSKEGELLN